MSEQTPQTPQTQQPEKTEKIELHYQFWQWLWESLDEDQLPRFKKAREELYEDEIIIDQDEYFDQYYSQALPEIKAHWNTLDINTRLSLIAEWKICMKRMIQMYESFINAEYIIE